MRWHGSFAESGEKSVARGGKLQETGNMGELLECTDKTVIILGIQGGIEEG